MNRAQIRAVIEQENPQLVVDLIRYANDLRLIGRIKDAADIKMQLLKLVVDDSEGDGELLVFRQVRKANGDS